MFGLGVPELIVIFLIVLVIFGARKLPEIGAGLGKAIQNFKKSSEPDSDQTQRVEKPGDTSRSEGNKA